jgi:hypothetical protein
MGPLDALVSRNVARLAAVGWLLLASTSVGAQTAAPTPTSSATVAPAERGRFAAVWVAPLATHWFQGAGAEAGYRYRWLVGLYRLGFLQNGYAPPEEVTPQLTLERTQRLVFELEVGGQLRFYDRVTAGLGVGAAFLSDRVDISSMNGTTWTTTTDGRGRVRPLVSATIAGPIFQASLTFYVGSNPEARFSFGVCWGRHARQKERKSQ